MAGKSAFRWWALRTFGGTMLNDILTAKWLEGHRTQITAVVLALLTLALNLGWITQEQYTNLMGFLVSIGLITASVHKTP